jgi:hypothetical protein
MRPLVLFYGAKWTLARKYGAPEHEHVCEPFGGFAGYSCYWEPRKVTLIERDPVIFGVWDFLKGSSPEDIMRLPTEIESLDELPSSLCQEARDLIGFWFNRGSTRPSQRRANWARPGWRYLSWGQQIRWRIANQVARIKHWSIIHGSWENAPDIRDTHWFVDPPYLSTGDAYTYNHIDRTQLAAWCRSRRGGYVQVCEADGATWLPFRPFAIVRTPRGFSAEAIFEMENN